MTSLIIEHTDEQGTLLTGSSRGDGSAEVVKALGWRWGRSIGMWFIPRSRNQPPKRPLIERTRAALEEADFTVEVAIDTTPQDRAEVEQRLTEQADRRTGMLSARADREEARAHARLAASKQITDSIPLGQPLLADHHSYSADLRRRERAARHYDAALEHQGQADRATRAAKVAEAATGARNAPVTVANRIERLATQIRKDERALARADQSGHNESSWAVATRERLDHDRADLAHWQEVRARQIADGLATNYNRDTVHAGDHIRYGKRWYRVLRSNPKTVTIEVAPPGGGTPKPSTLPWPKVEAHRLAG